ncbi:MAG: hypothetical protein JXA24_07865 [Proteobacteria bacterium]|nr:hypothetical protein [Pseudomonadota bacterium]
MTMASTSPVRWPFPNGMSAFSPAFSGVRPEMLSNIRPVSAERPSPAGGVFEGAAGLTEARARVMLCGGFPLRDGRGWTFSEAGHREIARDYYRRSRGMIFEGSRFDQRSDYLFTNEIDYHSALSAISGRGGAYAGVGHMLSFTYPAWQGAADAYAVDANARVPFITIPLYGLMLAMAADRIDLISLLTGKLVPRSAKWRDLVDGPPWLLIENLIALPGNPSFAAAVKRELTETLVGAAPYLDAGSLEHEASGLVDRIRNSILRSNASFYSLFNPVALMKAKDSAGRGGPLTSEEQLRRERSLFIEGRITGVASPIQAAGLDAVMSRVSESGDRLGVMYLSNLEDWLFDDVEEDEEGRRDGAKAQRFAEGVAALYGRLRGFDYPEESLLVSAKGCYPTSVHGLVGYLGDSMPPDMPPADAGRSARLVYRLRREAARAGREPIRQRLKFLEGHLAKRPDLAEIPAALRRGWRGSPYGQKEACRALLDRSGYFRGLTDWERSSVIRILIGMGVVKGAGE